MGASASNACEPLASCQEVEAREEFIFAVRNGDVARAERLLDCVPHLASQCLDFGEALGHIPALGFAIQQRNAKMVALLANRGAAEVPLPKHAVLTYEKRAQAAAESAQDDFLLKLVPETYFHSVCAVPHAEFFNIMVDACPWSATTAMLFVCHAGDTRMLDRLVKAQADPCNIDRGAVPLVAAVKSSIEPVEKVELLLRAGADPNQVGDDKDSALAVAAKSDSVDAVTKLLDAGADPNCYLANDPLPTVLFYAVYWGQLDMVRLLITRSQTKLNLYLTKDTKEDIFDVANTALAFARARKPKSIAKLPLPASSVEDCEEVIRLLDNYRLRHAPASSTRYSTGARTTGRTGRLGLYPTNDA